MNKAKKTLQDKLFKMWLKDRTDKVKKLNKLRELFEKYKMPEYYNWKEGFQYYLAGRLIDIEKENKALNKELKLFRIDRSK